MNANKRMKYASTPTYGMQKRGFSKKSASVQQSTMPDFTQFPMQDPMAPPFAQQSMASFPTTLFSSNSDMSQPSPFTQTSQSVPSPGGMPFQMQPFPMGNGHFSQPMPAAAIAPPLQQPLGNAPLVSQAQINAFLPRQQGFTPPVSPAQSSASLVNPQRPVFDSLAPAPYSSMGAFNGQAFPSGPNAPYMTQSTPSSLNPGFMGGSPMNMNAVQQPIIPMQSMQQMPAYSPQHNIAKAPAQPVDRDKVWMSFLFGALPLLFIPCLLVGQSLDFLRYAFIALCVTGLGAMWYRQMFTSSTRMTVSIIYAALCIVTISLLLNGATPARETSANGMLTQTQTSPNPSAAAASTPSPALEETPAPISPLGESEAEQRLSMFMNLWSAQQRTEMVSYIQPSWASTKENPAAELFTTVLFNRIPLEFTIESISGTDADNSRTVTMSSLIDKSNGKDPVRYRFMIVMTKEGGEWYVDPNTLSTNDIVIEDETVVASQTAEITLQPTMTVTPAPLASTLLYYNPDGGSMYHADPECKKVRSEYLPLQGSFQYSELESYNTKLQPCLDCRAPTKTLE